MVAVISVDTYPFLAFSDLTSHLENRNKCFLADSKGTKLRRSDQEASPSAGKNAGIVLVPCRAWKCFPTAIYSGVDISKVPGCHSLKQMCSQWGSQRLVSHKFIAYLPVFNIFLWLDYQKDVNQMTLNHATL